MKFHFYCTPEELREVFLQVEQLQPLEYVLQGLHHTWLTNLDCLLLDSFSSCRDISNFGRCCWGYTALYLYPAGDYTRRSPILLYYSGPPAQITDPWTLCQGELLLLPENKYPPDQELFKTIRSCFKKKCGFQKAGLGWLSPSVYANRQKYLFWSGNPGTMSGPWRLDENDQTVMLSNRFGEGEQGQPLSRIAPEDLELTFFAAQRDILDILHELEQTYSICYFEYPRPGVTSGPWDLDQLRAFGPNRRQIKGVAVCDSDSRTFLHLIPGGCWDGADRVVDLGKINHFQSVFGDKLYRAFAAIVRERFPFIDEPHYGPFRFSPSLWPRRHEIILNLSDPRFRIDKEDRPVHVWRKEWGELLAEWNIPDETPSQ